MCALLTRDNCADQGYANTTEVPLSSLVTLYFRSLIKLLQDCLKLLQESAGNSLSSPKFLELVMKVGGFARSSRGHFKRDLLKITASTLLAKSFAR